MSTSKNKHPNQLETLLQLQAAKITQLEKGQAIEAALDKVRTRTMAMQHPDELREVVGVLQEQISALQIADWGSNILIAHEADLSLEHWIASFNQAAFPESYYVKGTKHPFFQEYWEHYHAKTPLFTIILNGEKKKTYDEYCLSETDMKRFPEAVKENVLSIKEAFFCYARIKYGHLVAIGWQPLSEENFTILQRFAKVFEQSYTRFLDLKKAEDQARAAQIDAAIERIRAKALAMHHSHEVKEVANAMRTELMNLGIAGVSAATIWIEQSENKVRAWDFTNVQEATDSKDLGMDFMMDLEKGRAHPKAYFWNVWNNKKETYSVVESNIDTLYASMNWLVELDETMGKEMLHLLDTEQLTYWWHASAAIKKGTITIDFVAPPPAEMAIILPKMAAAFDLAYRRFEDLEKAEAQAKEAQIEAALERVRSRTMAMHKSEDLKEVVKVLYRELVPFGIDTFSCTLHLFHKEAQNIEVWMEDLSGAKHLQSYFWYGREHPRINGLWEAWEQKETQIEVHLKGGEKKSLDDYLFEKTDYRQFPEVVKNQIRNEREVYHTPTFFKDGFISMTNFKAPSIFQKDILQRFTKVFEQTYTRFLDLQKAEAQAREAQIEAALERVRSASMAMHTSEQLIDVASVLRNQLTKLNQKGLEACAIHLYEESQDYLISWAALQSPDNTSTNVLTQARFPKKGVAAIEEMINCYQQGKKDYVIINDVKKFPGFLRMLKQHAPEIHKVVKNTVRDLRKEDIISYWSIADFKGGSLVMTTIMEPQENSRAILRRFANVFNQAYTRFLDLQKAEAQAKEAQIEAALERVRSRTMAMHKSEDLKEVVKVLYQEIIPFGFDTFSCTIHLLDKETQNTEVWMEDLSGAQHLQSYFWYGRENSVVNKLWEAWEQKQPQFAIHLKQEEKKNFDNYLFEKTDYRQFPEVVKNHIRSYPEAYFTAIYFKNGFICTSNFEAPSTFQQEILQRFTKVFEQTYTRFLDLQKAEAQAREAQIEAALERVRAASMAMHKSEELPNAALIFLKQIEELGIPILGATINLVNEAKASYRLYFANGSNIGITNELDTNDFWLAKESFQLLQKGEREFTLECEGIKLKEWIDWLKKEIHLGRGQRLEKANLKKAYVRTVQFHELSHLIFSSVHPLTEDTLRVMRKITKAFGQSYIRFLDLQKAEAQAREAQIEAALERVRARAMAMHKSNELMQLVQVLFDQIKNTGIAVESSWVTLTNVIDDTLEFWIRHGNQESDALKVKVNEHPNVFRPIIESWKDDVKVLEFATPKAEFNQVTKELFGFDVPDRADKKNFQLLYIHHRFGYLGFGTWDKTNKEEVEICKRFAQVFEQTYTRFLDLQKAEAQAREAQIEAALERVRSRTMAMHHSQELGEVAAVLFEQVKKLDLGAIANWLSLVDVASNSMEIWTTQGEQALPRQADGAAYEIFQTVIDAWKSGKPFIQFSLEKKKAKKILKLVFNQALDFPKQVTAYHLLEIRHQFGYLGLGTWTEVNEEDQAILQRFAKVFEQTYTRFQDLQKAEAQAKEAQIEAALERVRSRTMAMHRSEELNEVVGVLYQQFAQLTNNWGIELGIFNESATTIEIFRSNIETAAYPKSYFIKGKGHRVLKQYWQIWLDQTPNALLTLKGKSQKSFLQYLLTHTDFKDLPESDKKVMEVPQVHLQFSPMQYGFLSVATLDASFQQEDYVILNRFAKVFEQTYTRFLDIQRAEAQAREAQIEAALERIRAKTMAMHKSEELAQVVNLLYHELKQFELRDEFTDVEIYLIDEDTGIATFWTSHENFSVKGKKLSLPFKGFPTLEKEYQLWRRTPVSERKNLLLAIEYAGQDWETFIDFIEAEIPEIEAEVQAMRTANIQKWYNYNAYFSKGTLSLQGTNPTDSETLEILKRFAAVFEQTYTRFLDLQKAEAQAREAQIEAALERVRAASMAMQTSGELGTILGKMLEEMNLLDMNLMRAIIWTFHPEEQITRWWGGHQENKNIAKCYTTKYEVQAHHPFFKAYEKAWKAREKMFLYKLEGAAKESWDDILFLDSEMKNLPDEVIIGMREPETVYVSNSFNEFGVLMISSLEPLREANLEIIIRFSNLFEQTYRRFLDVQEAEERAKEAKIEAALERIRARAMAMHHTEELNEVVAVIFGELKKMGFNATLCAIGIYDKETKGADWWSYIDGGLFPGAYHWPYLDGRWFKEVYEAWVQKKPFHFIEMYGAEWVKHNRLVFEQTDWKKLSEEVKNELKALAPNEYRASFISMNCGILEVVDDSPITNNQIDLLQRFTKVIDFTYTRVADLQQSEKQAQELEKIFQENQRLLHSILPEQIAEQIRAGQQTIVKRFEQVSILFADIVGFTVLSEKLSPQEVVDILNGLFSKFDDLTDKYHLEKIKTIGDAYMVAAGVPEEKDNHAQLMFGFAKEILQTLQDFNQTIGTDLKIRIGISSGPVVAGVIGKKKFAYDLWGDTVNTAARMEAYGQQDCIQISPTTYAILKNEAAFEKIPNVEIKGKGMMDVYLWVGN